MKNAKIKIFKDLVDFSFEYEESDHFGEFLNKFYAAVNACNDGRYLLRPERVVICSRARDDLMMNSLPLE